MKTFKSHEDLKQLSPNDPAYPVVAELVRVLIDVPDYRRVSATILPHVLT